MRILIVSAWDPTSGVLTVFRSLSKHLAPYGVRFSGFAFDGWGENTLWTFCDELIDGRRVTLSEVLMSGRYDLLHCVDTTYEPPFGVEKWVHRARFMGPIVLMAQVAHRELSGPARATLYVACSDDAAAVLALDANGPVRVITNGYDDEVFRPGRAMADRDRPLLAWVGRTTDPQKDIGFFLDTLELLPDYDAVLLDGIQGPPAERVSSCLHSGLERRAVVEPSQVADVFRTASSSGGAFVSTSSYEGFSLAALEAMACRCPVVAPRVPGYGHLRDGLNAVVFDKSEGPGAIVAALDRLSDPNFRHRLSNQAQRDVTKWTSRAMAEDYLRVYRDALERTAGQPEGYIGDRVARSAWRIALHARPAWHRLNRLARGGTDGNRFDRHQ